MPPPSPADPGSRPALSAAAGAMGLAVGVGISRFAYTPLLPALQASLGFGDAVAGAIASGNLLGYMVGAAWARGATPGRSRSTLLRLGLAGTVATTLGVVALTDPAWWIAVRLAAGVASGLVFVLVSAAVLEALPSAASALAGVLYSGVGAGIVVSGLAAVAIPARLGWRVPWVVLGTASAALAVPAWRSLTPPGRARAAPAPAGGVPSRLSLRALTIAYFLEGIGYIVSGTFVVTAVQRIPGFETWGAWVWVGVGLAAAPAPVVWMVLNRWFGPRVSLIAAYACQAVGIALPAVSGSGLAIATGAALFGGTFIGIATVTLAVGRALSPGHGERAIGMLTAVYGLGQVLGPILAGILSQRLGDARPAVLASSALVALGAAVLAWNPSARNA